MDDSNENEYGSSAWKAKDDANTLHEAEQIKLDPARHKAATEHLGKMRNSITNAHANARRSLLKKTGARLKSAFGEAAGNQDTPYVDAEGQ
jgi:hypothetical protein